MKGKLTLIPTPIDEYSKLNVESFALLNEAIQTDKDNSIFVVEDIKPGRKRWLNFGLPREAIENFWTLNEHTFKEVTPKLIQELIIGKNVFLMSDGGLPAFCDPGKELVYQAHKKNIKVSSGPFFNSVILALALSGLAHHQFQFLGFLPLDNNERTKMLKEIAKAKMTTIIMDTPYRLKRLLEELASELMNKEIFLAMDLNSPEEELILGTPKKVLDSVNNFKREFIIIISP